VPEYAVPVVAVGREDVEIFKAVAEITIVSVAFCVCTGLPLSCTLTVNVDVAPVVGVPEMVPLEASVRPAGRLPAAIDHVYADVPPVAANWLEYPVPADPEGSELVVIFRDEAEIVIVSVAD